MSKKNIVSSSVFWGIVLILSAVIIVLDGLGLTFGGMTPIRIIIGILFLAWLIYEIAAKKFANIFFPIAFLFLTFEEPLATALNKGTNLMSNWAVILAALLFTIGFNIVVPKKQGNNIQKKLGSLNYYFDASDMQNCVVNDNVGNIHIYIVNHISYPGTGFINISNNLGQVVLHIPSSWNVFTQAKDNIGKVDIPDKAPSGSASVTLGISNNLGHIKVVYE